MDGISLTLTLLHDILWTVYSLTLTVLLDFGSIYVVAQVTQSMSSYTLSISSNTVNVQLYMNIDHVTWAIHHPNQVTQSMSSYTLSISSNTVNVQLYMNIDHVTWAIHHPNQVTQSMSSYTPSIISSNTVNVLLYTVHNISCNRVNVKLLYIPSISSTIVNDVKSYQPAGQSMSSYALCKSSNTVNVKLYTIHITRLMSSYYTKHHCHASHINQHGQCQAMHCPCWSL